jgi:hypothetical protein
VSKGTQPSISVLHREWARLEDEHHELAIAMQKAGLGAANAASMRDRQTWLLLKISGIVARIREAPATTLEDYLGLLDVAIEHEIDLAADIAFYGPRDFPMIVRLLRALAERAPDFEFNSLRRWLSSPGLYERTVGNAHFFAPAEDEPEADEPVGFGEP